MSSHCYEVALFGEFSPRDLKAIMNRITLHSESSEPMHTREIVFEPIDVQHQRDSGNEPLLLRAKKELEVDSPWYANAKDPAASHCVQ
jgi:mediator of RNA polymerase II transcription subunit 18